MKLPSSRAKPWRRLLGAISVLLVLLGAGAVITGRLGYVVTDGISMEPLYHTGDLVVIAPASSYHVGQIVAYHGDLDGHLVVLHRIVGGNATSGFLMKGDNNHSIDPIHPRASQVIGRAILHIPKVGIVMKSPELRALIALVIVVLLLSLVVEPRRRPARQPPGRLVPEPRRMPAASPQALLSSGVGRSVVSPLLRPSGSGQWVGAARQTLPRTTSGPWVGTVSPLLRSSGGPAVSGTVGRGARSGATPAVHQVAGPAPVGERRVPAPWQILAGLTLFVVIAFALTFLVGSPRPKPTPPTFTQTGGLAYHARTAPSATYPSGQIVTGDAVFLKLVHQLGISYFFSTDAPAAWVRGTVRLGAVVSGENGWQISLPLVRATALKAGHLDLAATLDLARIEAIATQVSESTGTYTGTLSVNLTAVSNISFEGGKAVTSTVELPLTLSAAELIMSSGATTQTTHGAAKTYTSALNTVAPAAHPSSPAHTIRLALIGALLLLVAATVAAIPSEEPEERRKHQEA
ncbi:MAG: signal peptidase I [Acidimicrobiales bacterium]|jgi:signal peptidase I